MMTAFARFLAIAPNAFSNFRPPRWMAQLLKVDFISLDVRTLEEDHCTACFLVVVRRREKESPESKLPVGRQEIVSS
jgi:hypothetical protein